MKNVNRIFVFSNGTRIDLKKVLCLGALDKDEYYNIYIPVYCEGFNKPIKFIVGNNIGQVSEESKLKIQGVYNELVNAWEAYKHQEESKAQAQVN